MKLSPSQKRTSAWLIVAVVVLAVSLAFGITYPIPEPIGETTLPLGTTHFSQVDVVGSLQYGANDLYPVGYASSGEQAVLGTQTVTGTATAAHGLTTVTWALCSLAADPGTSAGDAAVCSVAVSGNTVTLKAWQDDFAAATNSVSLNWLVVGTP